MRKTKIICTLGPSTDKDGVLRELVANGMNVHLRGEGIAHAPAAGIGVGHKGALAPLADHQALVLQLADGLAGGVAADIQRPAQLCLSLIHF